MHPAPAAGPRRPKLAVVLPGYNEAANVERTLRRCAAALAPLVDHYEILVVDDGSEDGMGGLAEALAGEIPALRVLRNPINLGVGASLLIGFRAARAELVVHDAMDYPFDLADLARALPLFPEVDIVVVARTDRSAHSRYRKLTSLVHYWLVRLLFRVRLRDMNFVQVYKREVFDATPRVRARSPAFVTPEILIRARDRGLRIAEIEATFHGRERGKASYGKPRDILWTLADMLSFWLERRIGQR